MPATVPILCGHCAQRVAADVLAGDPTLGRVAWLRCPACLDGSVRTVNGSVWPVGPAGGSVANLPDDVAQAWREARTAHAVAAYTASEIMCRKILMHLAVDVAASAPGKSFVEYIDALDGAGYIAPSLKPSVDKIRVRGNAANHDLPASTEADALVTLRLTEFLLRGIYEIPQL